MRVISWFISGLSIYLRIFTRRLLTGNLDVVHQSEFSHGGHDVRLANFVHRLEAGLFDHEALPLEIASDVSYHGVVSLDSNAVHAVSDLKHEVYRCMY